MIQIIIILLLSSIKVALCEHPFNHINKGLICNGQRYDPKKYPYVVTLMIYPEGDPAGFLCTGSLISELYVLTAAHCTFGVNKKGVKVYQGSFLNNKVERTVAELHLHKDYNPEAKFVVGDICVIKLKRAFPNLNTFIEIGGEPEDFADHKALQCVSIGFGKIDNKSTPGMEGNMIETLVRHGKTDCKDHKRKAIVNGWQQYLCSQPTTEDDKRMTCHGDSGGPMICNNKLYGICSHMYTFGKGDPVCDRADMQNVHVFIHYFLKWVNNIIFPEEKKKEDKKEDDKKDDKKEEDKKDEKKKKKKKKKKKSSGNSIKPYYKFHIILTILLYFVLTFI